MTRFMTVKEVARTLRRSQLTIYRWIAEGVFENVSKVKDGYLIPEASVNKIIRETQMKNLPPE